MIEHSRPWITDADRAAVDHQLISGMIASLEKTRQFERALNDRIGASGSIATTSGTAALVLCLKALSIGPGDEVILPTYVCRNVMQAIVTTGAKPVLCDTGDFWNATERTITDRFSSRTKAIVAVNIFGISAELAGLREHPYLIIEDHCQSLGLPKPMFGAAAFYSFHAIKCLTSGEGGAAAFSDRAILSRASELKDAHNPAGAMSDLQAVLGLSQLSRYDRMLARRREIAERYFAELPARMTSKIAEVASHSIFFRFPLCMGGDFDSIQSRFGDRGVAVRRGVDQLLHRLVGQSDSDFPSAVALFNCTVSIPIYPAMSDDEVDKVIEAVKAVA